MQEVQYHDFSLGEGVNGDVIAISAILFPNL